MARPTSNSVYTVLHLPSPGRQPCWIIAHLALQLPQSRKPPKKVANEANTPGYSSPSCSTRVAVSYRTSRVDCASVTVNSVGGCAATSKPIIWLQSGSRQIRPWHRHIGSTSLKGGLISMTPQNTPRRVTTPRAEPNIKVPLCPGSPIASGKTSDRTDN